MFGNISNLNKLARKCRKRWWNDKQMCFLQSLQPKDYSQLSVQQGIRASFFSFYQPHASHRESAGSRYFLVEIFHGNYPIEGLEKESGGILTVTDVVLRPRSSSWRTTILSRSYIYIYTYESRYTRDISIAASSACRGNNSATTHYTGPAWSLDGNQARRSIFLSFFRLFAFLPRSFIVPRLEKSSRTDCQVIRRRRRRLAWTKSARWRGNTGQRFCSFQFVLLDDPSRE